MQVVYRSIARITCAANSQASRPVHPAIPEPLVVSLPVDLYTASLAMKEQLPVSTASRWLCQFFSCRCVSSAVPVSLLSVPKQQFGCCWSLSEQLQTLPNQLGITCCLCAFAAIGIFGRSSAPHSSLSATHCLPRVFFDSFLFAAFIGTEFKTQQSTESSIACASVCIPNLPALTSASLLALQSSSHCLPTYLTGD